LRALRLRENHTSYKYPKIPLKSLGLGLGIIGLKNSIQQIIRAYQILLVASVGFGHLAVQTFDSHLVTDYTRFFGERHIHFKPHIAIWHRFALLLRIGDDAIRLVYFPNQ